MILLESTFSPQNFFTLGSFTTLAGATGIVYIVCGAIQQAFNFSPKWLALAVSMIISFIGAFIGNLLAPEIEPLAYLLAFLNGFLIYMTATGTNQLAANNKPPVNPKPKKQTAQSSHLGPPKKNTPHNNQLHRRSFNSNWWNN